MSPGSILSWFADNRYAHISIWSKTGLQEVKPFSISFGQRSCDVKLPRRVSSRHVVCGSNIAGGSGWGSLISASIAVIGGALTIAAASDVRVSCSSWVSCCDPNAPINVNPVGGGVRARGGDLTDFKIFRSNSPGWETKVQSKVSKKPLPQGEKSKQTML